MPALPGLLDAATAQAETGAPLASWNEGPAKQAILDFVRATTASTSIPLCVPSTISKKSRIESFAIASRSPERNGLERLAVPQFGPRLDEVGDMFEAEDDLRIDRMLDPERAVLGQIRRCAPLAARNPCSTGRAASAPSTRRRFRPPEPVGDIICRATKSRSSIRWRRTSPKASIAVKILLDDPDPSKFPIGAEASAAIYTDGEKGAWAALRKISIRAHSWFNWLYPMPF